MEKPIFSSTKHQILVSEYMNLMLSSVKECSTKSKFENFKEVFNIIIEYHNGYGKSVGIGNWNDWLMILPINLSVMTNGYFAGLETKRNAKSIRVYKVLLDKYLEDLVTDLSELEFVNE